nr:hypothetical protein [Tanacetum cinerariifolium]
MRNENPICTLGDYSKPSHEGYRNTIKLPVGNNVVPLRSDTINWCKTDTYSMDFEQRLAKKNELKARETLLMALPDKHQLKFNIHKDSKSLIEAIEKGFGGNKETKKSNSPQLDKEDLKQIDADDLEKMDLKWQMTMLTMRARRWNATIAIDKAILLENACHLGTPGIKTFKEELFQWRLLLPMLWCHSVIELVAMIRAFRLMKNQQIMLSWHFPPQAHQVLIMSSELDVSVPTSLVHDRYKSGEGYHVVPPPYTRTFMPLKPDLVFYDAPTASETVPNVVHVEPSPPKPNKDMSQSNRPTALIIEDWVSNSEDESDPMPTHKAPSLVQTSEHVKTPRTFVKPVEHPTQAENLRKDIPKSRGHKHSWNMKACFICISLNHLIKDCDFYETQMVYKPVRNHAMRVHHQNSVRMTHSHPNKHVVPTTFLTRSRLVPLNAARPVTTAVSQTTVKTQRPAKHVVNKLHLPIRRPINHRLAPKNSNFPQKVTIVKTKKVNAVQGTKGNWV